MSRSARRQSINCTTNETESLADRVRVSRQHRLDPMTGDLSQIGIVDAGSAEVGHVAVAALMGADV